MSIEQLISKINERMAKVAVIGLGYVGLPVAAVIAEAGFNVLGVEINTERVNLINQGISPIEGNEPGLEPLLADVISKKKLIATTDYSQLKDCDIILIDVETPVDEKNEPRYKALEGSLISLGPFLKRGALVIIESTIAPGTIQNFVLPILEEHSGYKVNTDFYLGNCPERVMPGKLLLNLSTLSRVVGGGTPETVEAMIALYRYIVKADLDPTDWVTAELVKTTENAYRDVQIAFANEVAIICEALGADIWKVRELVNKSPFRNMHLPGAGVGGHCIPKDPWLLAYGVKDKDVALRIIPAAREVNNSMPRHVAILTRQTLLKSTGQDLDGSKILVMGYAYLEDSDDTRNSPSAALVEYLEADGAEVVIHDPYVSPYQGDISEMATGCDAAILMVAHSEYRALDLQVLKDALKTPVLIDGRGVYNLNEAAEIGITYRGVGQ